LDAKTIANLVIGLIAAGGSVFAMAKGRGTEAKVDEVVVAADTVRTDIGGMRDTMYILIAEVARLREQLEKSGKPRPVSPRAKGPPKRPGRGFWNRLFGG
jgi:hypothetical protein